MCFDANVLIMANAIAQRKNVNIIGETCPIANFPAMALPPQMNVVMTSKRWGFFKMDNGLLINERD